MYYKIYTPPLYFYFKNKQYYLTNDLKQVYNANFMLIINLPIVIKHYTNDCGIITKAIILNKNMNYYEIINNKMYFVKIKNSINPYFFELVNDKILDIGNLYVKLIIID